jgi:hypothetical protein
MSGNWAEANAELIRAYNNLYSEFQNFSFKLILSADKEYSSKMLQKKIEILTNNNIKKLRKSGEEKKAELEEEIKALKDKIKRHCPEVTITTGGFSGLALPSRLVF